MKHKWKVILWSLLLLTLVSGGCQNKETKTYSEIRFIDFLLPNHALKMQISGPDETTLDMVYGEASAPVKLKEGIYRFRVLDGNDRVIIEKKLGIGKETSYTIAVSGILIPSDAGRNVKTLKTKLLEAAEGATANPDNAAMPVLNVFLDRFEGNPEKAKLKAVHLAPGLDDLELFIKKEDEFKKVASLSYPNATERDHSLPPGTYPAEIRYKSSSVVLYQGNVTLKAGHLTTLFIYGVPEAYPYKLAVKALINQSPGKND
ncbi:MAG TPA: hypothetical protein VE870_10070 [Bacteroidales bacterium]|nr:hypothetical protein [Bacteroidales bacterium]